MLNPLSGMRQTVRALVRSPAFTLSAVLTLALGMAATTIIFSTFYHMVMRPLPYDRWQDLVQLMQERDGGKVAVAPSRELMLAARANATTLDAVELWMSQEQALTGEGEPVVLAGAAITSGMPAMLGVPPLIGRMFTDAEMREAAPVVLLGEELWRTRFGGSRDVIGRALQLGPESRTVIGVMPAHFSRYQRGTRRHEFWTPLRAEDHQYGMSALGRIRPGIAAEAVSEELEALAAALPSDASRSRMGAGWTMRPWPMVQISGMSMNARSFLPRLLAAAVLLLLIGCANVAGLLLIRLHVRRREIAIRSALGAHRHRLLGELVREQLLLAAAAGVIGVLLSVWGLEAIRGLRPEALASLDTVSVNGPIMLFAAGLVLLTTLLFGALPAIAVLRRDLVGTLQTAGGPRLTSGTRARSVLVTLQLALSTMLLVGGFLLVRTVQKLENTDLGFNPDNTLVAQIPMPSFRYDAAARETLLGDVTQALREVPGVASVAVAGSAPPRLGMMFVEALQVEGSNVSTEGMNMLSGAGVGPGYFATIGARLEEGREFQETDAGGDVAVVTREFVETFWPGQSGLGRRFRTSPNGSWQTIVGVVRDIRQSGSHSFGELTMFWGHSYSDPFPELVVRTAGNPLDLAPVLRQVIARSDPDLPIRQLETMTDRMAATIAVERFNMVMLGLFAAVAVLLCAVGLYGLVSYSLEHRIREVGVRIALGATPAGIRALFMSQAVRLVVIGVALGVVAAVASTRLLGSMIQGVSHRDPVSFIAAVVAITAIVLPATWLPARRAARVEPLVALREE